MQFYNTFILKLQYICCNVHFLNVVKLQYICSNFTTLYFKDTFLYIVKLYYVLVINFHYIYRKITIDIFNSVPWGKKDDYWEYIMLHYWIDCHCIDKKAWFGFRIASASTVFSRLGPQRLLSVLKPQEMAVW